MTIGALVAGAVGLVISWVSAGIISVTGLDTGDGKLYGGLLVAAGLIFWWHAVKTNALARVLLFLVWLGTLALAAHDVASVSAVHDVTLFGSVDPGAGLYLDTAAALVGLVAAILDVTGAIASNRHIGVAASPTWMPWAAGLVSLLAVIGAGVAGHNYGGSLFNPANQNVNDGTGNTGTTDNAGTGSTGNTATGGTGTGTTGNTGSGNTGTTGNTGNTSTGTVASRG